MKCYNLTLYSYPNHFDANRFRALSLYNINQILIRFLQSKLISNSFLRANDPYLELCKIMIYLHLSFLLQDLSVTLFLRSQFVQRLYARIQINLY